MFETVKANMKNEIATYAEREIGVENFSAQMRKKYPDRAGYEPAFIIGQAHQLGVEAFKKQYKVDVDPEDAEKMHDINKGFIVANEALQKAFEKQIEAFDGVSMHNKDGNSGGLSLKGRLYQRIKEEIEDIVAQNVEGYEKRKVRISAPSSERVRNSL